MSFGQRLRERREELGMTRGELAKALGVSQSAISNYESGLNAMREEVLLRLFKTLDVEPNYLYQDAFTGERFICSTEEERLVKRYRSLTIPGRQAAQSVMDALTAYQADLEDLAPEEEVRQIPLYRSPAAASARLVAVSGMLPPWRRRNQIFAWARSFSAVSVKSSPMWR